MVKSELTVIGLYGIFYLVLGSSLHLTCSVFRQYGIFDPRDIL